jgi:hypothetical protein
MRGQERRVRRGASGATAKVLPWRWSLVGREVNSPEDKTPQRNSRRSQGLSQQASARDWQGRCRRGQGASQPPMGGRSEGFGSVLRQISLSLFLSPDLSVRRSSDAQPWHDQGIVSISFKGICVCLDPSVRNRMVDDGAQRRDLRGFIAISNFLPILPHGESPW